MCIRDRSCSWPLPLAIQYITSFMATLLRTWRIVCVGSSFSIRDPRSSFLYTHIMFWRTCWSIGCSNGVTFGGKTIPTPDYTRQDLKENESRKKAHFLVKELETVSTAVPAPNSKQPVSYTHLDVYKRQVLCVVFIVKSIQSNLPQHDWLQFRQG